MQRKIELTKRRMKMLGAVIGDIVGQPYELYNIKSMDFNLIGDANLYTDDTVMTIAVADGILNAGVASAVDKIKKSITEKMIYYGRKYPHAGYGGNFQQWIYMDNPQPYNSWGNGSAMRVSSVPWFYTEDYEKAIAVARASAEITHNHQEGIKGAECTAAIIWLANQQHDKDEIEKFIKKNYYALGKSCNQIRPNYRFDVSCMGTMPVAIQCFLESTSYENCLRIAVSMGGDTDTICAIAGAIAEAYYGIPYWLKKKVCTEKLEPDMLDVLRRFDETNSYT